MAKAQLINNTFPESGIRSVESAMDKAGFVNPFLRVAVLSVVAKESSFKPKNEYGYGGTSNSRLRSLFSRVRDLSDSELTSLKKNNVAFYEKIYGGRYGNKQYGDAWKYRGRGFNQLTFRGSYEKYAKLSGHPIDKDPDLLNRNDVASDVLIAFMKNRFDSIPSDGRFPVTDPNAFTDQATATRTVVNANHGWKRDVRKSHPETLEKAVRYSSIFRYPTEMINKFTEYGASGVAQSFAHSPKKFLKRNWLPITIVSVAVGVGGYFLIRKVIWKK